MKKVLGFTLILCMVFTLFATVPVQVSAATSGICGENLTWTFDDVGTLTISGTGEMKSYGLTSTPWYDFRNSIKSVHIEGGVTSIGDYVFSRCASLTSIEISGNVTSIGDYAFYNCDSLTNITIPDSVTSIGEAVFYDCDSLTSIEIPNGVTGIADYAFYNCDSLTSITIPDSVTSIGEAVFYDCDSLTSIEIPNGVTSIGDHMFYYCTRLTSIEIPDSVTSIGGSAFSNCIGLTSIEIPDSVTSIGSCAFDNCGGLTSIEIPNSVTSIGERAFRGCSSLEKIVLPFVGSSRKASHSADAVFGYIFGRTGFMNEAIMQYYSIKYHDFYSIPKSLREVVITDDDTIPWGAFSNCSMITNLSISNNTSTIATDAFWGCYGLTSMIIPNGVTKIGDSAFSACSNITNITIPNSVSSIGDNTFLNCTNLNDVFYLGAEEEWNQIQVGESNECLKNATVHYCVVTANGNTYASFEEAFAAIDGNGEIKLLTDITLGGSVTVEKGKSLTIDLNGKTITGTDTTSKNFGLFNNNGTLTVNDTAGDGAIVLTSTVNSGWNRYSAVISNNPGGVLVVNGGRIEHIGGTDMAYGIDALTNSNIAPVETTINGGVVKSTYRGIRQFLNSTATLNKLTINGGVVEGENKAIFFHDPSAKANVGELIVGEDATVNGGIYLFVTEGSTEWPVNVSISANAVDEVTSKNVPEGYKVIEKNGFHTVVSPYVVEVNGNVYKTFEEALSEIETSGTITLLGNVEIDHSVTIAKGKDLTIDLNGNTITGTDTTSKNFGLFNNNGTLTINDTAGDGAMVLTATVNSGWNRYSAVISNNPGGVLVVNGGRIEHLGGTDMAYGIDALTNSNIAPVETTINGGVVKSTYRGIRQFLNSTATMNKLTINGGVVEGENKAIFFHDPSAKANVGELVVGEDATVNGGIYLFVTEGSTEWPVNVSISANAVDEVTSKNVPEGYGVVEEDGVYTVADGVCTINFIADGEVISEKVYRIGAEVEIPKAPLKGGYVFAGWDSEIVPANGNATYTAQYETVVLYDSYFKDILTLRTGHIDYNAAKKQITVNVDRYKYNLTSSTYGFAIVPNDGETVEITYNRDNGTAGVSTFKAYSSDKYTSYMTGVNAENGGGAYGKQPVYIIDRANGTRVYLDVKITRGDGSVENLTVVIKQTDFATEGDVDVEEIKPLRADADSFVLDNEAKTIYYETLPGVTSAGFAVSVDNSLTATTRPRRILTAKSGMKLAHGEINTNEKNKFDRYVVARRNAGTTQTYQVKVHGGEDGLTYTWYTVTVVFK